MGLASLHPPYALHLFTIDISSDERAPSVSQEFIINGFGRQKVYPPVGRCIYCGAKDCDLSDEHIIPQGLGGNILLPAACCSSCERIVGAQLEGRLLHKTNGMFAAMRLRLNYKSKRPKDRPKSLPYKVISKDGVSRIIEVPARSVPRHWMTFLTQTSPGVIQGRSRTEAAGVSPYSIFNPSDFTAIAHEDESIQFVGAGEGRDLARLLAKIAHGISVAQHGIDAFEAWLPDFILGKDDCAMHYYVAGHENKTVDDKGDHSVTVGTWEDDGVRIGVRIRLFCKYGTPDYEVAVGKLKK